MDFLLGFHSGWRYVVLVAGLVTLVAGIATVRAGTVGHRETRAVRLFTIALDVQLVAGIGLLFVRPFFPQLIGHLVLMVAAVALAHLLSVTLKRRPPERRTPGLLLTGVGLCVLLIVAGIMALGRPVI